MNNRESIATVRVPSKMDDRAPDGSEIRLLVSTKRASFCHCTLPPQSTSLTGVHHTIEEVWYCLHGQGQVWRKGQDHEAEVDVFPGVCLTIPPQTQFQFRSTSWEPLCFIISTMPPWPGPQEWQRVPDHWLIQEPHGG